MRPGRSKRPPHPGQRRPAAAPRIVRAGIEATYAVIRPYIRVTPVVEVVDHVVLVSDAAIRHAQEALWAVVRVVAEPGGAAALAGLLGRGYTPAPGERVGVLVRGGKTTAVDFHGQAPATGGDATGETVRAPR